jgi:HD-like signal output (HDOD) protein
MAEPIAVEKELERIANGIGIPPCPAILTALDAETRKENPSHHKIEELLVKDVGLSGALLKLVNSPFYGLRNKVSTVRQAIRLLGLRILSRTVAGLLMRRTFVGKDQATLEQFWETSAQIAKTADFIAKQLQGMNREESYTFGLFQNCGMAMMLSRFPTYKETIARANETTEAKFTDVEDADLGTDHAVLGALITRAWGLPPATSQAIRHHHDYAILSDKSSEIGHECRDLVAIGLFADKTVQRFAGRKVPYEWEKGGAAALRYLGLTTEDADEIFEDSHHFLENW